VELLLTVPSASASASASAVGLTVEVRVPADALPRGPDGSPSASLSVVEASSGRPLAPATLALRTVTASAPASASGSSGSSSSSKRSKRAFLAATLSPDAIAAASRLATLAAPFPPRTVTFRIGAN
jgi:hypothetical protein